MILRQLTHLGQLRELDLQHAAVSDAGLRPLNAEWTKVAPEGTAGLRKAMPQATSA